MSRLTLQSTHRLADGVYWLLRSQFRLLECKGQHQVDKAVVYNEIYHRGPTVRETSWQNAEPIRVCRGQIRSPGDENEKPIANLSTSECRRRCSCA